MSSRAPLRFNTRIDIGCDPFAVDILQLINGQLTIHPLFNTKQLWFVISSDNRLCVAYAMELLRETRLDMERVAEQAGFSSTRQLHRAWQRIYKKPPRDARPHLHKK